MKTASTLIELRGVRTEIVAERSLVVPVDGVDLELERGETFALVGESGSGKSFTALSIARLLPENARIAAGTVDFDGVDLVDLPERAMRKLRGRRISMIFQEPSLSLNPVMPVGAQIVEAIRAHATTSVKHARSVAIEWLRRVGLSDPERRFASYPFQLSGGQKQRVMIAIALAAEPELLIADEPTTALDVTVQKQVLDLLAELKRERGLTMLLITHDLGVVARYADRIALMYAGQLVEIAATRDFLAAPKHPYARSLLDALPRFGRRDRPLAAIAGAVPALDRGFDACRFAPRCPSAVERCRSEAPALIALDPPTRAVRCHGYAPIAPVPLRDRREGAIDEAAPSMPNAAAQTAAPPLLKVDDLRVSYRSATRLWGTRWNAVVHGVSFELHAGRTLALVGESGSGKTTIGKAVLRLLGRQARVDGRMLLDGHDLRTLTEDESRTLRRTAQVVFQDPYASLNPRMRVGDIVLEGMRRLRPEWSDADRDARVARLLDRVGLERDALSKYPHEFSGGQRQRIAIARALSVEPRLIVCDEPTSALDVSIQAQILNMLAELQRDLGLAYLFISHNLAVVDYLAHDIAVLEHGRIVEHGAAHTVLRAPRHAYTRTLLASVPDTTRSGLL